MRRILIVLFLCAGVVGVAFLATLGCCQLLAGREKARVSFSDQLRLTGSQRQSLAPLEKEFLARKQKSCQILCEKRAQLIQLLTQPEPDRAVVEVVVKEIGQEQASLEQATLDHLIAMRQYLDPPQREKLTGLMTEQLRLACKLTACGAAGDCFVEKGK